MSDKKSTKTTKTTKKRSPLGTHWGFTWNNYDMDQWKAIMDRMDQMDHKYIAQEEIGEEGTRHLQAFLISPKRFRPIETFGDITKEIHWGDKYGKPSKKKDWVRCADYCRKTESYEGGPRWCTIKLPRPTVLLTKEMMRPEQLAIAAEFEEPEDPLFGRKVHWIWDTDGCVGKSILAKYMVDCMGAMKVSGANDNILCGVTRWIEEKGEAPDIIIFDLPRKNQNKVSYAAIEQIKDGCFFSGKYESGMCRFNSPHIIVFANKPPDMSMLSMDRWKIRCLDKNPPGGEMGDNLAPGWDFDNTYPIKTEQ